MDWSDILTHGVPLTVGPGRLVLAAYQAKLGGELKVTQVTAAPGLPNAPELATHVDPSLLLADAYVTAVGAIREATAMEPLTAGALQAIALANREA